MSFGDAVKSFFSNYVNFKGRARRSEFWYSYLFIALTYFVTIILDRIVFGQEGVLFYSLAVLATFIPFIAVCIRRLHDINKTGWWYLLYLIPLVGFILLIVWGVQETEPAANQWGQPAK